MTALALPTLSLIGRTFGPAFVAKISNTQFSVNTDGSVAVSGYNPGGSFEDANKGFPNAPMAGDVTSVTINSVLSNTISVVPLGNSGGASLGDAATQRYVNVTYTVFGGPDVQIIDQIVAVGSDGFTLRLTGGVIVSGNKLFNAAPFPAGQNYNALVVTPTRNLDFYDVITGDPLARVAPFTIAAPATISFASSQIATLADSQFTISDPGAAITTPDRATINNGYDGNASVNVTGYTPGVYRSVALSVLPIDAYIVPTGGAETKLDGSNVVANSIGNANLLGYVRVTLTNLDGTTTTGIAQVQVDGSNGILLRTTNGTLNATTGAIKDAVATTGQNIVLSSGTIASTVMPFAISSANTACFTAETTLASPNGPVRVADVAVGQLLLTAVGPARRVIWVGRTHVAATHPRPAEVMPVRVRSGAFGPALPGRDLRLSPDHAVFVDGVLIPVKYLVDDHAVVREPAQAVDYYHVEFDIHDVIMAEGLPVESYLDTGGRAAFDDQPVQRLHPSFGERSRDAGGCAPLVVSGPVLMAVRTRLAAFSGCVDSPDRHAAA